MNRDENPVRRRVVVRERRRYQVEMEQLVEFVDNELGNGGGFQRPDDTDWRIQRRKSIEELDELRKKLDKVCVYCNYGKGVGDSAEIAGAAASIVGALMAFGGCSSAQTVMNVGKLIQHSGALLEGTSNVTEAIVSNKYLSDVQAVLKKDQELSRPLMNWLLTSANLDATISQLFGCDLSSAKLSNVLKTFYEFSRLHTRGRSFQTTLDLMKRGRFSVHLGTDVKLEYLQEFAEHINRNPALSDTLRTALSVLSVSVGSLQVGRDAIAVYRDLCGEEGPSGLPSLRGGINPEIPTVGAVSTFCVLQTISIASNVVSLVNVVKVIREGKSAYSDALKQLSELLELELRSMEAL